MPKKQVFTLKTYGAQLYKWTPIPQDKPKNNNLIPFYCNAKPFSQGQDWIGTYSYNLVVVNYQQQRIPYVECDYVQ